REGRQDAERAPDGTPLWTDGAPRRAAVDGRRGPGRSIVPERRPAHHARQAGIVPHAFDRGQRRLSPRINRSAVGSNGQTRLSTRRMTHAALSMILGLVAVVAAQDQPEFPTPRREHSYLRQFEGEWEAVTQVFGKEDQPAYESTGRETAKLALGGFWLCF